MSGGERRRLDLVRILFSGSELLLLDEPTNHLDADARDWLLRFLRDYPGALMVVSHDLDLLDNAITRVLHLDRDTEEATGQLVEYRGTYSQYLAARQERDVRLATLVDRQGNEVERLRRRADSMRGQTAKRARVAKNLDARARRLDEVKVDGPSRRRPITVRLPDPPASGHTPLEVAGVGRSFGELVVFEQVSFTVGRGERLLIMGLNGAGKTTLLKVLAGRLVADAGQVLPGHNARIGYFAQEHDGIVDGRSLLDHMSDSSPADPSTLRGVLGMFGLTGDKAFQDAATLSGGEKTRLALAQLVAGGHNVLLLDEPTNHLDPESRRAIGQALSEWPGTMILVSHDVEFVRALQPDRVLFMPEGQLDYADDRTVDLVELA